MKRPVTGKDLMIVNMGPHHPSMHGVLRLIVTLDDIGAQTPFFYIFREREFVYDLFEAATERVEGVGIIGGEEAINWGLSGPMLRASGNHGIFVKLIVMSLTMNLNGKFSGKNKEIH
ncbi:hypothetical protein HID58_096112 [Brassica napus]|uniref:NADH-quinone oxidoreductase subunit D domain-containing protein n=1 Tax=Brassica napus TaxID=3708 RepID=A0ABQ7X3U5_BRANA|nr:hypothetical protein HID58_096112 [Brassica napus]